jgi:ubiquinone/menaquinone biosynthesis C-methylase UbiE
MQILGATEFYRDFMIGQIASLKLIDGMTVLDLGAGTGEFTANIAEGEDSPSNLHVVSADLVFGALQRARARSSGVEKISLSFCAADFECALPFRDHSFDRVLASLLVAYVGNAKELLNEVRRVLRPGGILVLSSPRRDADLSSLYRETISTISPATIADMVGVPDELNFDDLQRNYLNEAAKLVDLEELGHFKFRDTSELCDLLSAAGFVGLESALALGNPPQTAVVTGVRGE